MKIPTNPIAKPLSYASLFLLPLLVPLSSQAAVLDWNSVTWTRGSTTQSFDIDPTHAGNDIRVTLTLSPGAAFQANNPAVSNTFTGGGASTAKSLNLNADFASSAAYIHVQIDFLYAGGVNNTQFSLFDVDRNGTTWQDQVRNFSGLTIGNSTVLPTNVTGSSGNTMTGSLGTGYTVTGNSTIANSGAGSANANVGVAYGQSYLKSVSFDYGSGSNVQANPEQQGIALGNITFTPTPTPEINPSAGAVFGCGVALLLGWRRKRSGEGLLTTGGLAK